jgi:hypothetical protein
VNEARQSFEPTSILDRRRASSSTSFLRFRHGLCASLTSFRKACRRRSVSHRAQFQAPRENPQTCFEGPFGEPLRATGPMAKANPFGFSTKYQDDETDSLYYGYRYYNDSPIKTRRPEKSAKKHVRRAEFITLCDDPRRRGKVRGTFDNDAGQANATARQGCRLWPWAGVSGLVGDAGVRNVSVLASGVQKRNHGIRGRGPQEEGTDRGIFGDAVERFPTDKNNSKHQ